MFEVLKNRTYRHLFLAQIVALVGTGLATVALLAFDLAGKDAGAVLGTALAIKMIAYVLVAPIAGAYANRVQRRARPPGAVRRAVLALTRLLADRLSAGWLARRKSRHQQRALGHGRARRARYFALRAHSGRRSRPP